MKKMVKGFLPIVEGKCIPVTIYGHDGEVYSYYPEPDPDYVDPEIRQSEKYRVDEKEEFYNYVTVCNECGCEFIAYFTGKLIRKYCPCCGENLE